MVGRPSSSGGMGMDASMSQPDFDMEQARPHTALGLSQVSFDGSGASALESASAYDLEYKKRFGDYRALSAPDGGGGGLNASAGSLGQSGRLRTEVCGVARGRAAAAAAAVACAVCRGRPPPLSRSLCRTRVLCTRAAPDGCAFAPRTSCGSAGRRGSPACGTSSSSRP